MLQFADDSAFLLEFNNMTASFTPLQPPVPAERHAHLFPDAVAPRGASFNPEEPSGASYMRNFERLTQEKMYAQRSRYSAD